MLWVPSATAIIGRPANLGRTKRPKAADNGVAMNSCEFAEIGRLSLQPSGVPLERPRPSALPGPLLSPLGLAAGKRQTWKSGL